MKRTRRLPAIAVFQSGSTAFKPRLCLAIPWAAVFCAMAIPAFGADRTWNNATGYSDWNSNSNWDGNLGSADAANFAGTAIESPILSASSTISKIRFRTDSDGYMISGAPGAILTLLGNQAQGTIEAQNTSGVNHIAANIVFGAAADSLITIGQNTGGTLNLSGNLSSTHAIGELIFSNKGVITIAGENTYAGTTRITGGGTTNINHESALSTGSLIVGNNGVTLSNTSGRAIHLAANNDVTNNGTLTFNAVAETGDLSFGSGSVTATGANRAIVVSNLGSTLTIGSLNADLEDRSIIIGTNTSSGKLLVSEAAGAGWAGDVRFAGGVLELGHHNALGEGTLEWQSNVSAGSSLLQANRELTGANAVGNALRLGSSAHTVGTAVIGGEHAIEFSGSLTNHSANRTLTINNSESTTFSGDIYLSNDTASRQLTINGSGDVVISGSIANNQTNVGNGRFTYSGTGVLQLTGENTYTGTTTVSSGTLVQDGTLATGNVVVSGHARLTGRGTIAGATSINGVLAASAETGALTFSGDLSLNEGASFRFSGGDDDVSVSGTLSFADNWTLALVGNHFADGGSTVLFTFGTLNPGSSLTPTFDLSQLEIFLSGPLTLSQVDQTIVLNGISVVTPIPEPSTFGLAFIAVAATVFTRRQRRTRF